MLVRACRTVGINSLSPHAGTIFVVDNEGVRNRCESGTECVVDCLDIDGRTLDGEKAGRRGDTTPSADEGPDEDGRMGIWDVLAVRRGRGGIGCELITMIVEGPGHELLVYSRGPLERITFDRGFHDAHRSA